MPKEQVLRVFVSSPSDVAGERARVKLVADRLNGELEGIVRLDILRWEDGFYTAAHSFQEAIDQAVGNMSATDMVLCIVWKRAGLKLNPAIWRRSDGSSFESGTVATETASFSVDSRCQTLHLAGKVSKIAERKHAVIHLDVARSFVPSGAGLMLVPHFQLVY